MSGKLSSLGSLSNMTGRSLSHIFT
ncbi:hypothetical protein LINPERPRIM_LOCUS27338 [Linum perenne]